MGASASFNCGNTTENNVSTSVVNEQSFSVENITRLENNLKSITENKQNFLETVKNQTKNVININQQIDITGDNNKIDNKIMQQVKLLSVIENAIESIIADTQDFQDISIVETISDATSTQDVAAVVDSAVAMTTQVESSGIGALALGVSCNNTSISNVNTSISNLFKSVVSSKFSNDINRVISTIASINSAKSSVNDSAFKVDISQGIKIIGNGNLVSNDIAQVNISEVNSVLSSYSSTTKSIKSITDNQQKTTSIVDAKQSADVSVSATNTMSSSVKTATLGGVGGIIMAIIIVSVGMFIIKKMNKNDTEMNQKII